MASGISKSEVSRICGELDGDLEAFRTRPLEGWFLRVRRCHLVKTRVRCRVISRAVVVATGVRADGAREVLGLAVGESEDGVLWAEFLRSLRNRGLTGVKLVTSDHHRGLKNAISEVCVGASWQRSRVHFMRNVLARVPKASTEMVAAAIRTSSASPMLSTLAATFTLEGDLETATERRGLALQPGRPDLPNDAGVLRLITAVIVDTQEEWHVAQRRYLSEESVAALAAIDKTRPEPLLAPIPHRPRLTAPTHAEFTPATVDLHDIAGLQLSDVPGWSRPRAADAT